MSENKNLLSCPFCGGEAELKEGRDEYDKHVECKICGCRTKIFNEYFNTRDYAIEQMKLGKVDSVCGIIIKESAKKAIEAWNRRTCSCGKQEK